MAIRDAVSVLADIGVFDVVLPFLLVFTLSFGLLQRNNPFGTENGKPKKRINAMVSFVFGFLAVAATNILQVINIIVAYFVLALIVMVLLALILGITGAHSKNKLFFYLGITFFAVFILYGLATAGLIDLGRFLSMVFGPVLILGAIALALYAMFSKPKKTTTPQQQPQQGPQPAPPQSAEGSP